LILINTGNIYQLILQQLILLVFNKKVSMKYLQHLTINNSNYKTIFKALDLDLVEKVPSMKSLIDSLEKYPSQLPFWDKIKI